MIYYSPLEKDTFKIPQDNRVNILENWKSCWQQNIFNQSTNIYETFELNSNESLRAKYIVKIIELTVFGNVGRQSSIAKKLLSSISS